LHLHNRFRVIETPRTFAAKFSQRDQRQNETAEEYAADLKRLSDLAHKRRDEGTRREDLVRRFLDGLRDEDVRWEVEYVKEPRDNDEAVYHVVNYIQTRKRHQIGSNRRQRPVRRKLMLLTVKLKATQKQLTMLSGCQAEKNLKDKKRLNKRETEVNQ